MKPTRASAPRPTDDDPVAGGIPYCAQLPAGRLLTGLDLSREAQVDPRAANLQCLKDGFDPADSSERSTPTHELDDPNVQLGNVSMKTIIVAVPFGARPGPRRSGGGTGVFSKKQPNKTKPLQREPTRSSPIEKGRQGLWPNVRRG